MTVVLVEHHSIDSLLSFDDDFDGVVDRLEPATVSARE
jgi:predicted nucleic acid-binding protein